MLVVFEASLLIEQAAEELTMQTEVKVLELHPLNPLEVMENS